MKRKKLLTVILVLIVLLPAVTIANIYITKIEPTPLFPKVKQGELLKQVARLFVSNTGEESQFHVRVSVAGKKPYTEALGTLKQGENVKDIHILDIDKLSQVNVQEGIYETA